MCAAARRADTARLQTPDLFFGSELRPGRGRLRRSRDGSQLCEASGRPVLIDGRSGNGADRDRYRVWRAGRHLMARTRCPREGAVGRWRRVIAAAAGRRVHRHPRHVGHIGHPGHRVVHRVIVHQAARVTAPDHGHGQKRALKRDGAKATSDVHGRNLTPTLAQERRSPLTCRKRNTDSAGRRPLFNSSDPTSEKLRRPSLKPSGQHGHIVRDHQQSDNYEQRTRDP